VVAHLQAEFGGRYSTIATIGVQARAGGISRGAVVGLRQTGQRLTSILIPSLMGGSPTGMGSARRGVRASFV
jgi:hypothetical protein